MLYILVLCWGKNIPFHVNISCHYIFYGHFFAYIPFIPGIFSGKIFCFFLCTGCEGSVNLFSIGVCIVIDLTMSISGWQFFVFAIYIIPFLGILGTKITPSQNICAGLCGRPKNDTIFFMRKYIPFFGRPSLLAQGRFYLINCRNKAKSSYQNK